MPKLAIKKGKSAGQIAGEEILDLTQIDANQEDYDNAVRLANKKALAKLYKDAKAGKKKAEKQLGRKIPVYSALKPNKGLARMLTEK